MWLTLVSMAFAGKWDDVPSDITAEKVIPAPAEKVFSYLLDLGHLRKILPEDCVGLWEPGERSFGEGANATVRYDIGVMHRKLPMTLVHANAPTTIDFDHLGPRGFLTRWTLAEAEGGTKVSVLTPINAPPAPLKGYYYNVIRPEWQGCYTRALDNLAAALPG